MHSDTHRMIGRGRALPALRRGTARIAILALAILLGGGRGDLWAQGTDEESAVLSVIDRLFDAMRANDADGVRSVFVEGASLIQTEGPDGSPMTGYIPVERFATMVGNATQELDEPYWDPVVQVHDHLASVWVKYALYVDGRFSHCGVDTFILTRGDDGWKIASLADTRERDNCELPPDRQPYP